MALFDIGSLDNSIAAVGFQPVYKNGRRMTALLPPVIRDAQHSKAMRKFHRFNPRQNQFPGSV